MLAPELHRSHVGGWLRAAVLGANDGIVSIASLVLGVAAAEPSSSGVIVAGLAGLVGGALSMAAGEYVSVSSQRDVELADLAKERAELAASPGNEHAELVGIYVAKGLSPALAEDVACALEAAEGPLRVHAREELRLDPDELARPLRAAVVSALSFAVGGSLPFAVMVLSSASFEVPFTLAGALAALALLGAWSARLGGASVARAIARVVVGGALAMGLTYVIGLLAGSAAGG